MSSITIKINGQFVSKSSKNIGAAGSSEAFELIFEFDEEWLGLAKRIIWRDSRGENATSVILVPEVESTPSRYVTAVPSSATMHEGWCSFCVEGYYPSSPEKVMKSVSDYLFVEYADVSADIIPPTKSEAMQLQSEFESLMPRVSALMEKTKSDVEILAKDISLWENYREDTFYKVGNKVAYDGKSFVCIRDSFANTPDNNEYWLMISDRGERGQTGNQGPQGVRGERGEKGDKGEKGDRGEKGDKGERGLSSAVVPSNGFYTFSVDDNGDLWLHYPDEQNPPEASLNEKDELILSVEGLSSHNLGTVKYVLTEEDKTELTERVLAALPNLEEVSY